MLEVHIVVVSLDRVWQKVTERQREIQYLKQSMQKFNKMQQEFQQYKTETCTGLYPLPQSAPLTYGPSRIPLARPSSTAQTVAKLNLEAPGLFLQTPPAGDLPGGISGRGSRNF